jgi:hypothetical protein
VFAHRGEPAKYEVPLSTRRPALGWGSPAAAPEPAAAAAAAASSAASAAAAAAATGGASCTAELVALRRRATSNGHHALGSSHVRHVGDTERRGVQIQETRNTEAPCIRRRPLAGACVRWWAPRRRALAGPARKPAEHADALRNFLQPGGLSASARVFMVRPRVWANSPKQSEIQFTFGCVRTRPALLVQSQRTFLEHFVTRLAEQLRVPPGRVRLLLEPRFRTSDRRFVICSHVSHRDARSKR